MSETALILGIELRVLAALAIALWCVRQGFLIARASIRRRRVDAEKRRAAALPHRLPGARAYGRDPRHERASRAALPAVRPGQQGFPSTEGNLSVRVTLAAPVPPMTSSLMDDLRSSLRG